jgi:hypothetical protein
MHESVYKDTEPNAKPRGLANSRGVCYANSVLQCLAAILNPHALIEQLGARLGKPTKWPIRYNDPTKVHEILTKIIWTDINPAADFMQVMKLIKIRHRKRAVHPYRFQAALALKGKKNSEKFASNQGGYPYPWLQLLLQCLCEGPNFDGEPKAVSDPIINRLFKISSLYERQCRRCDCTWSFQSPNSENR